MNWWPAFEPNPSLRRPPRRSSRSTLRSPRRWRVRGRFPVWRPPLPRTDVWRFGPTSQDRAGRWQASQTVSLHSGDGAALLKLVGELQQMGLAVNQLAWQLAPETARKARHEATADALRALRGRADEAAGLLGLQFNSFKEVRLENPPPAHPPPHDGGCGDVRSRPGPSERRGGGRGGQRDRRGRCGAEAALSRFRPPFGSR